MIKKEDLTYKFEMLPYASCHVNVNHSFIMLYIKL